MKILVTGAAGFIGFHTVRALLDAGYKVVGIDNICSYYDVHLKYARLKELGLYENKILPDEYVQSDTYKSFQFIKMDLIDGERLKKLFKKENFTYVIHLAAQAGVRYSLQNPHTYINSNITGFINILEACRYYPVKHLVYASSSSVYGNSLDTPFKESDNTDSPVSLYAVTKKANELMAYSYAKLYNIHSTGIRFFTVYGPWGRPDMAPFLFLSAIIKGETIKLFNNGNMMRDFTFIDDIVTGILKIIPSQSLEEIPHTIYNMGCSATVKLTDFLSVIEHEAGMKAIVKMTVMQPGDVISTYADTTHLKRDYNYKPSTPLKTGVHNFYNWFTEYYKKPHHIS